MKNNIEIREFHKNTDREYTVIAENKEYSVDFEIYKGYEDNSEELPICIGYIKWDSCSNWDFPNGHYPLHFCDKEEMEQFNSMMISLYDWAKELLADKWLN